MGTTLRDALEQAIAERGAIPHPDAVAPILAGQLDPTARESTNRYGETITAELRSIESAFSFYTIESFFIGLTPLGMICVAYAMLQILAGDFGELPEAIDPATLDPWHELAAFRETLAPEHEGHDHDRLTCAEECRRALWHLSQAYEAIKPDAPDV